MTDLKLVAQARELTYGRAPGNWDERVIWTLGALADRLEHLVGVHEERKRRREAGRDYE